MTLAICIKCGGRKFGAYVDCKGCGFRPITEEDFAKSMMMSDHHFSEKVLDEISGTLRSGKEVEYSSENVAQLIDEIRKSGARRILGLEPPMKSGLKPWWKFF